MSGVPHIFILKLFCEMYGLSSRHFLSSRGQAEARNFSNIHSNQISMKSVQRFGLPYWIYIAAHTHTHFVLYIFKHSQPPTYTHNICICIYTHNYSPNKCLFYVVFPLLIWLVDAISAVIVPFSRYVPVVKAPTTIK